MMINYDSEKNIFSIIQRKP